MISSVDSTDAPTTTTDLAPRIDHRLFLEFGDRKDFDDPRKEWRRLFSELLGTFALVLVAAGAGCCTPRARSAWPPRSWRPA